jgi:hypothetical protein
MPYLDELDSRGYRYYFQFTILGYPREIDPKSPPAATAVEAFRELADGSVRSASDMALRPYRLHRITPPAFHEGNFRRLAESLRGHTRRVVVSIVDMYRKIEKRMKELEGTPAAVRPCDAEDLGPLMRGSPDWRGRTGWRSSVAPRKWICDPSASFPASAWTTA